MSGNVEVETVKIKTAELTGLPLRWMVATATRKENPSPTQFKVWGDFCPDVNWMTGGSILNHLLKTGRWEVRSYKRKLKISNYTDDMVPVDGDWNTPIISFSGDCLLQIGMLAVVAQRFGLEVSVPAVLVDNH